MNDAFNKFLTLLEQAEDSYPFLDDVTAPEPLTEAPKAEEKKSKEKKKKEAPDPFAAGDEKKEDAPAGDEKKEDAPADDKDPFGGGDAAEGGEEKSDEDVFKSWIIIQTTIKALKNYLVLLDLLLRRDFEKKFFEFQKKVASFDDTLQILVKYWKNIKERDKIIKLVQHTSIALKKDFINLLKEAKHDEQHKS